MIRSLALALVLALGVASPALAEEPWMLELEGGLVSPLSAPQNRTYSTGGFIGVAGIKSLVPWFGVGLRLSAGVLSEGDPPSRAGLEDPGVGGYLALDPMVRLRPFASSDDVGRGDGIILEAGIGPTVTGDIVRANVVLGITLGFAVGELTFAPFIRYMQIVHEEEDALDQRDARLALLGLEIVLFDTRAPPPPPPEPPVPISDRDHDRIMDSSDACPDEPEDRDGFDDLDGCPDPDNDGDGVTDENDQCPEEAEDQDGWQDDDGCPDPDNDGDGVPDDAPDRCLNEGETLNGVEDQDGCPDQGLIEMRDNRIVLEEAVLFDFERARIRNSARPVLEAIVTLVHQHPEWRSLRVEGHADSRGDMTFNQELSERRARNIMRALSQLGIPADVIDYIGYGAEHPRDNGESEEAFARNRRVEFVVLTRSGASNQGTTEDIARQRSQAHENQVLQDLQPPRRRQATDDERPPAVQEPAPQEPDEYEERPTEETPRERRRRLRRERQEQREQGGQQP